MIKVAVKNRDRQGLKEIYWATRSPSSSAAGPSVGRPGRAAFRP